MWTEHPFLPFTRRWQSGQIVARCAKSMDPDAGYVVFTPGSTRPITCGDTAQEAMANFDAGIRLEVAR